ncbi:hypothetical protein AALM74_06185 [Parabacteroides segnis]|uniref:fimbrillin family protein n=1 Tax=Parabacteroides segnis TaxID=2763058 RepID=UPI0035147850
MKTLVLSMISIAATIAAMTACTSEGDPIDNIDNGQPVEIKASAGIGQIITKTAGVITDGTVVDDIEFIVTEGESAPADWSAANLTPTDATIAADKSLTFTTPQYYNSKASIKSFLVGYHPKNAGSGSREKNTVSYTITGQQDIMCTEVKNGNKTDNKETKLNIEFEHQLAQYSFQILAGDEQAVDTWGKIKSIELIGQQTTATLTLNTKTLTFSGDATNVITAGTVETGFDSTNPTTTPVQFGSPIMVKPTQTGMKVKVVTVNNPDGIEVLLNVESVVSTSYIVTLTFKATEIGATAKIGEWKTGVGTGDVQ